MKELLGALLFLTVTITVFSQKASKITLGNFGEVTSLTKHFFEDLELNEGMASSYLAPGGSKPEKRQGVSDLDYAYDVAVWESRYGPGKVNDGDSSTVWSEGVEGPGIGEVIVVGPVDISKPMLIWSGHGKSNGLFYANNRPEEVEIYTIEAGDVLYGEATIEASVTYRDLSIYGKHTVTLQDHNGYQELPIRKPPAPREGTYLIAVKINSVYPGTKYDDTCISEITQSDHIPLTAPPEELTTIVDYYNTFPYQFFRVAGFPKFRIVQKDGNYVLEKEYECCESLRTIDPDNNYLLLTSEGGDGFTNYHFKLLGRKSGAPVVLINNVRHEAVVQAFPGSVLKLFKLTPEGWAEKELVLPELAPDNFFSGKELDELREFIDEFKIIYRYSNQKNRLLASLGFSKLNMSNFDSNKVHKLRRSLLDQPIELKWDPEKGQFETE